MLATGRGLRPHLVGLLSTTLLLTTILVACPAAARPVGARPTGPEALIGSVVEISDADQAAAERLFSAAEAALYLPDSRTARAFVSGPAPSEAIRALPHAMVATEQGVLDFTAGLERDFPGFRVKGRYLLKLPATARALPPGPSSPSAGSLAAVSSDSFESGLPGWALADDTQGASRWGTTTCEARTGARSADAVRGGTAAPACQDPYSANVTTQMAHAACEAINGASKAWLDLYIHTAAESGYDTIGFYYADAADDQIYGYSFAGNWPAWYHLVFNLKQWYALGDLTTLPCPKLYVQFSSNASGQPGFGARIDDLSISTGDAPFLSCSITASPASGPLPLAVNFGSVVTGASGGVSYQWSFGNSGGSTATTPAAVFVYTAPGDYDARLRVEDANGRAYAHAVIHVTPASACSLSCTASAPSASTAGAPVSFQATATPSNCTGSPAYSWAFGDGQTSAQQNPSHTYASAGTYPWSLTVSVGTTTCTRTGSITVSPQSGGGLPGDCNGDGAVSIGEVQNAINMVLGSVPWSCGVASLGDLQRVINAFLSGGTPACSIACTATVPAAGTAGTAVGFTSTATPSNCTGSPAYSWVFGDNQTSSAQSPSHTYASAGTYNWALTVSVGTSTCQKSGSITITSTPSAVGPPVGAGELTTIAMTALGALGTNGSHDLEGIITTLRTGGPDAAADLAINRWPTLITRIASGVKIDYGSGYTHRNGTVSTGSVNVTWSNVVRSGGNVSGTYRVESQNYTTDGRTVPIRVATGSLNATQAGDNTAAGDVTLTGTDAGGATVASGNAHFDTKVCKKFPISGTVVDTVGGARRTITFNPKCDGSFGYDAPLDGYYGIVGTYAPTNQNGNDCYTPPGFIALPIYVAYLVAEGGRLTLDPAFTGLLDPKYNWTASAAGWFGSTAASLKFHLGWTAFDDNVPYARLDVVGSFTGVRTAAPAGTDPTIRDYFIGPTTLTFTTSAPYRPCTTTLTTPATLLGPCPKAHCAD